MALESSVGLENISVNNATTIHPITSLQESVKGIEICAVCLYDLKTTGLSDDCDIFRIQLLLVIVMALGA